MQSSKEEILSWLRESREHFSSAYGVSRIGVFGSAARGNTDDAGDIDVLVDMPHPTFDHYMDLKFEIEDHFGMPVDLVLLDSLKERLRPRIESEVLYV